MRSTEKIWPILRDILEAVRDQR